MSFLLGSFNTETVIEFFVRLLIIFAILPIHEYAHGYAANKLGDNTALISGRLTLNPLAHIDPIGAVFLLLFGFGWAKPVPINPRNFKHYKKDIAITAFAGPLSNILCALFGVFLYRILLNVYAYFPLSTIFEYVLVAILYFSTINISLGVFNLIPVEPLDGSRILSYFLPAKANAWLYKYSMYIRIILLVALYIGILSGPLSFLVNKLFNLFNFAFSWVDILFKLIIPRTI